MHKVLTIAELSSHICSYLDPSSLAATAQSCKTLNGPATPALWTDIPDFTPLVKLLPKNSWVIKEKKIKLTRVLLPSDWDRVLKHSDIVKTLGHPSASCSRDCLTLDDDFFTRFCAQKPVMVLLPRLRSVNWCALRLPDRCLSMFTLLLGSNLRNASISTLGKDAGAKTAVAGAVAVLSQNSPCMRQLHLEVSSRQRHASTSISSALTDAIPSFQHLVDFHCTSVALTKQAMDVLASLPDLAECALRLPQIHEWSTGGIQPRPFPNLKRLSIVASAEAYTDFSRAFSCPQVTSFDLDVITVPKSQTIPELFSGIRRQFHPRILDSLAVYTSPEIVVTESMVIGMGATVLPGDFAPLLDFARITTFEFSPPWAYRISDGLILDMAQAWPFLQDFALANSPFCIQLEYGATLRSLAAFAVHSPVLEAIAYPFDGIAGRTEGGAIPDDLYGDLAVNGAIIPSTSIVADLTVQRCPIAEPAQDVAVFLSMLFPELNSVDVCEATVHDPRYRDEYRASWREVSECLDLISGGQKVEQDTQSVSR
ncbi:hypothetical protein TRAPUB_903 [Trametes pubescens]|uniref:F-box domain-containing protein n=1 Tax=Trametes pubescens TaxID=154538 RepID=A0A1M2VKY3_TRAPU|nr:hypothetical protein TRAPUB_903 [Trametes pubescens]